MMRIAIVATCLAAASPAVLRAQDAPEIAHVGAPSAAVRSGPGEDFYATDHLARGQQVEIYRRKPDGWCAIRPPEGSFSYVRADHVRPTDAVDVLEVTHPNAKTRVGSRISAAYQAEYVTLRKGERLQLLGGPVRPGTSRHAWYRVAPPAGEFRWVHQRHLQLTTTSLPSSAQAAVEPRVTTPEPSAGKLSLPAATSEAPRPPAVAAVAAVEEAVVADPSVSESAPASESPETSAQPRVAREATGATSRPPVQLTSDDQPSRIDPSGLQLQKLTPHPAQMATEPIRQPADRGVALATYDSPSETRDSQAAFAKDAEAVTEPETWIESQTEPLSDSEPAGPPADNELSESIPNDQPQVGQNLDDPQLKLVELELALSRMVTQDVPSWNLVPLYQELQSLAASLPDAARRQEAARLMERVEEFGRLQHRHHALSTAADAPPGPTLSLAAALSGERAGGATALPIDTLPPDPPRQFLARQAAIERQAAEVHFAGQGWLVPVISTRPDLPRFALTDTQGAILAFVSPRPGLNLRRYQRREVGIVGRETADGQDPTPHLLADRVVVLDRQRR